jgi:hypothetical protein
MSTKSTAARKAARKPASRKSRSTLPDKLAKKIHDESREYARASGALLTTPGPLSKECRNRLAGIRRETDGLRAGIGEAADFEGFLAAVREDVYPSFPVLTDFAYHARDLLKMAKELTYLANYLQHAARMIEKGGRA